MGSNNTGVHAAYDRLSVPIMVCDDQLVIRYVNSVAQEMFTELESDLQTDLPKFRADDIIGRKIDDFHKDPSHQRHLIAKMKSPHLGRFKIGSTHLGFHASPSFKPDGGLDTIVVEWQNHTSEMQARSDLERFLCEMQLVHQAHEAGETGLVLEKDNYDGDLKDLAKAMNAMLCGHISFQRSVIEIVRAFGDGHFDHELEDFPGERAYVSDSLKKVRDSFRGIRNTIARVAGALKDGDLTIEINLDEFQGDYRDVMGSFDELSLELSALIGSLNEQIDAISQTAEQVSASSSTLSTGAQQTSGAIEEISSSFNETESQVRATQSAATRASTVAAAADETTVAGRTTMTRMKNAMEGIDTSSKSISSINKVIDEIAFQTNLLALNAAVEAARAGPHGRGFAVVAQEVRILAQRSAKAAQETTSLIEQSSDAIAQGVEITETMDNTFDELSEAFAEVQTLVREIDHATREQSTAISQINLAVSEISSGAAAADTESSALATGSSQLSSSANHMRSQLSRYRLRKFDHGRTIGGQRGAQAFGNLPSMQPANHLAAE